MNDTTTFPAGTQAECNRCKRLSPLPRACEGHLEMPPTKSGFAVYRLDTMCLLDCLHLDAHWVTTKVS